MYNWALIFRVIQYYAEWWKIIFRQYKLQGGENSDEEFSKGNKSAGSDVDELDEDVESSYQ